MHKNEHALRELEACVRPGANVLIATHDFPDPDCLASALGLQHLLRSWGAPKVTIAYGGFIGRLENQAMVRLAGIEATTIERVIADHFDRVLLVDAYPGSGNVSLPEDYRFDVVIDHHHHAHRKQRCFEDIRTEIAATSSIITGYIRQADCELTPELATALFYGIKTDTNHMRHPVSPYDLETYHWLFPQIDLPMLANIEDPPRTTEYFRTVHDAIENMNVRGDFGYAHLPDVGAPDLIAEMTDFVARDDRLRWTICSGICDDVLYFSVRSKIERRAGTLAGRIARSLKGSGGGHALRGAGQIPLHGRDRAEVQRRFVQSLHHALRIQADGAESIF